MRTAVLVLMLSALAARPALAEEPSSEMQDWALAFQIGANPGANIVAIELEHSLRDWFAVAGWGGYGIPFYASGTPQGGFVARVRYPLAIGASHLVAGLQAGPAIGGFYEFHDSSQVLDGIWAAYDGYLELRSGGGLVLRVFAGARRLVYGQCIYTEGGRPCSPDKDVTWVGEGGIAIGRAFD